MGSPDDEELKTVLLAIAGSDAAFESLVRRHQSALRTYLRRLCGNAALADDLAQTAFLKAWRNMRSLNDAKRFLPWLRRIALNAAIDAARRRIIAEPAASVAELSNWPGDAGDQKLDIDAALQRLTFGQRACVMLHFGEGMSHGEVAAALKIPVGTVKSHLARATPLLRLWLTDWSDARD